MKTQFSRSWGSKLRRNWRDRAAVMAALIVAALGTASAAHAGVIVAPGVAYRLSSLKPITDEATPNYYSYGLSLVAGWSIAQVIDVAGFIHYAPSRTRAPSVTDEALQYVAYGAELGFRMDSLIYLGLRAGVCNYQMFHARSDDELRGKWDGPSLGGSLGVIKKINRDHFLQMTFDLDSANLAVTKAGQPGHRKIDTFGLSVTYVFNTFDDFLFGNTFMKGFIDSLGGG